MPILARGGHHNGELLALDSMALSGASKPAPRRRQARCAPCPTRSLPRQVGAGIRTAFCGAARFQLYRACSLREVAVPADRVARQLDAVLMPSLIAVTLDGFLLMQRCSAISSLVRPSAEVAYGSTRPRRMA